MSSQSHLNGEKYFQPAPQDTVFRRLSPVDAIVIVDDVRRAMTRDPAAARAAALRLVALLTVSDTDKPPAARGGLAPWQKNRIDRYIRAHFVKPMRLERLAEEVSLSASHFCRAFKESFGETPHTYVVRLRLERAQSLMLTTDLSLCEIALDCGLCDQAHLSKLFRSRLAESPNAWRRRNLAENRVETTLGS